MRVLVLDDQEQVLRAVARALRRDGHDVIECSTCEQAMAITELVDVAVLDVELPDGRGDHAAQVLLDEGRAGLVVFYTGLPGFKSSLGIVIEKPDLDGLRRAFVVPKFELGEVQTEIFEAHALGDGTPRRGPPLIRIAAPEKRVRRFGTAPRPMSEPEQL